MHDAPSIPKLTPDLRLFGSVDDDMLTEFFRQQDEAPAQGPLLLELSSSGGEADVGRRIALELRLWQEKEGREVWFLGRTYVYSAAVTIMSAIAPRRRFITQDCELLVHERKMKKDIRLDGALRACRTSLQDALAEVESGQRIERDGFALLVEGTGLSVDDVQARVMERDWYLSANDALKVGLVAGLV